MAGRRHRSYASIPNALRGSRFERIARSPLADEQVTWVATEKLHGSNLCMVARRLAGGETDTYCCRRNDVLLESEPFFNAYHLLRKYEAALLEVLERVHGKERERCEVFVYGELIGGVYPGSPEGDWETRHLGQPRAVQRGIHYCPHNEFVAFDVFNGLCFVEFMKAKALLDVAGFLSVDVLAQGSLTELLKLDPSFESTFSLRLGLPPVCHNLAEGYVLRPVGTATTSSRALIKLKSPQFQERTSASTAKKRVPKPCGAEVPFTPELNIALEECACYITQNRLHNVTSKFGEILVASAKMSELLALDALEEFNENHPKMVQAMKRPQQKKFRRLVQSMAADLVSDVVNDDSVSDGVNDPVNDCRAAG